MIPGSMTISGPMSGAVGSRSFGDDATMKRVADLLGMRRGDPDAAGILEHRQPVEDRPKDGWRPLQSAQLDRPAQSLTRSYLT
jgi:hypothetical protein